MSEERETSALSPEARALDELAREARGSLRPRELDWDAIEARLMDRIAEDRPSAEHVVLASEAGDATGRRRSLRFGAIALAAAAAIAVFVRKDRDTPLLDATAPAPADGAAGSLRATEGAGEVRVSGISVSAGHLLRAGDVLEADGARAVLERPRRVTWLLEKEGGGVARARVKAAAESLVVGLDEGAIEAQVVPVTTGEAFAVDVSAASKVVRVAVHGTHLRVARAAGSRVVVDLSEGVVSIGAPPRSGSTYGKLVTAPAHVEFDVADLERTLRVDHAPSSVRTPVPLGAHEPTVAAQKEPTSSRTSPPQGSPQPLSASPAPAPKGGPAGGPDVGAARPAPPAPQAAPPRDAIAAAVRGCAAGRSRTGEVRVTVSSTLKLQVGPGGVVESAVFAPPLAPEIQTCAAAAIYKVKLDEPGLVTIPIEFSY